MKTSERTRIPRTVTAILAVLILIAAAAAGNAAAQTGAPAPMDPGASLVLPEITGYTVSQPDGRSFNSPGQARTPTDESALPGGPYTNTAPAHEEPQGICDRNQAVQDSVLAELPNVSQCSGVTGEHLRGLSVGHSVIMVVHTWPDEGPGRIISARRATRTERRRYEEKYG